MDDEGSDGGLLDLGSALGLDSDSSAGLDNSLDTIAFFFFAYSMSFSFLALDSSLDSGSDSALGLDSASGSVLDLALVSASVSDLAEGFVDL